MTTKRGLIRTLKAIKENPRPLSTSECDELILLLGGTIRPNHRPERLIFGKNKRMLNWTALGDVVFGFLARAEEVAELEAELKAGTDPRQIVYSIGCWLDDAIPLADATLYVNRYIDAKKTMASKSKAEAIRRTVAWFIGKGVNLTSKQVENELSELQRRAGLKRLGLTEWRKLTEK